MNLRSLNLLLVEDDQSHAELIELAIADSNAHSSVVRVGDGRSAIAYLRASPPHQDRPMPDIVLLDLKLPDIDGLEILHEIKSDEKLRNLPVIALTTSAAAFDRAGAYAEHANSYLVKPVDYEQFRRMILDLERYWSLWNSPPPAANAPIIGARTEAVRFHDALQTHSEDPERLQAAS